VAASAIRHQYLEEMRHAFEALVDQIERIVRPQGNALPDGPGTCHRNARKAQRLF
jgi:uncharacterized protein YnzC (UPF0291/DUF896 family)